MICVVLSRVNKLAPAAIATPGVRERCEAIESEPVSAKPIDDDASSFLQH